VSGASSSGLDLARSAEAMQWSSRANEALRKGDIEQAERSAAKASELLPDNAVLKTDYAWAASLLPARRKIGDVGNLLDLLKEASEADPALDRPYYVRGTIFEHLGLYEKAYAEFRGAFARNAHNAEAAAKIQEYVRRYKATGSVEPDGAPDSNGGQGASMAGGIFAKLWERR
jgi:tetratricopeptide (TPR) repeat protein